MSIPESTYSVTVTADVLQAMREVLYGFSASQSQAIEASTNRQLGLEGPRSRRRLLAIAVAGLLITIVLFAMTTSADVLARLFLGSLLLFFSLSLIATLLPGPDRISGFLRRRITNPLIRWTVHREVDRAINLAPFTVVYRFSATSYTSSSPELKTDRTLLGDDISLAYRGPFVFCLYPRTTSQHWKAIIYAPDPEHRIVVEAFLQSNHVEVRELAVPPPLPAGRASEGQP